MKSVIVVFIVGVSQSFSSCTPNFVCSLELFSSFDGIEFVWEKGYLILRTNIQLNRNEYLCVYKYKWTFLIQQPALDQSKCQRWYRHPLLDLSLFFTVKLSKNQFSHELIQSPLEGLRASGQHELAKQPTPPAVNVWPSWTVPCYEVDYWHWSCNGNVCGSWRIEHTSHWRFEFQQYFSRPRLSLLWKSSRGKTDDQNQPFRTNIMANLHTQLQ